MHKLKSHDGCNSCRHRKKKCDERRPVCTNCMRLGLTCSYSRRHEIQPPTRHFQVRFVDQERPLCRSLGSLSFDSPLEESVFARVPATVLTFYSPGYDNTTHKDDELRLLMAQDNLFRDTVVACFSVLLHSCGHTDSFLPLPFARALTLLRQRLAGPCLDLMDIFGMLLAINFLGLLESEGPNASLDLLHHFKAILTLASQVGASRFLSWSSLPTKLSLLLFESILYHASVIGIFSHEQLSVAKLWQDVGGMHILQTLNPPGPRRIVNSPLITGQYTGFQLVLRLCCLHRYFGGGHLSPQAALVIHREIQDWESSFNTSLAESTVEAVLLKLQLPALPQFYYIMSDTLRVCLLCLQPLDVHQAQVDTVVSRTIARLLACPTMGFAALIWSTQILLCAVRISSDFDTLLTRQNELSVFMDPGSQIRSRKLIARLRPIKARCDQMQATQGIILNSDAYGMFLLRKSGGVLG